MEMRLNQSLVDLNQISINKAYVPLKPREKIPIGYRWPDNLLSPEVVLARHDSIKIILESLMEIRQG